MKRCPSKRFSLVDPFGIRVKLSTMIKTKRLILMRVILIQIYQIMTSNSIVKFKCSAKVSAGFYGIVKFLWRIHFVLAIA